jgi:CubicO group peptidase (beta-lactamase class C family)
MPGAQYLVYSSFLLFLSQGVTASSQDSDLHAAIKQIEFSFDSSCKAGTFSGAALIAVEGKILFKKACGQAIRGFKVNNTTETKFDLCSVGKLFTSIAIAELIEEKKLSLNDPVHQLLPTWLPMTNAQNIQVIHLLTHASGLGNFMEDKRWQNGSDLGLFNKTDDYKPLIAETKLLYKPGQSQSYSNSGYLLLGKVIEKISGLSYSNFITEHIFNKAGMSHSGIYALDEVIENKAVGYDYVCEKESCRWKNNYFSAPFIGTAAGGSYSTVDDLYKLSQALSNHQLLNQDLSAQVLSQKIIPTKGPAFIKKLKIGQELIDEQFTQYGFAGAWNQFGFAVWDNPDLVGHTGGTTGASALFLMSPNNHYTIIILSNMSSGTTDLYKKIRAALHFNPEIKNY